MTNQKIDMLARVLEIVSMGVQSGVINSETVKVDSASQETITFKTMLNGYCALRIEIDEHGQFLFEDGYCTIDELKQWVFDEIDELACVR